MGKLINTDDIPWDVDGIGFIPVIGKDEIDAMPEAVVRCIECKHCSWADHYDALIAVDPLNYCPGVFDYFCDYFDMETEEDGYCAWGERREDGIQ